MGKSRWVLATARRAIGAINHGRVLDKSCPPALAGLTSRLGAITFRMTSDREFPNSVHDFSEQGLAADRFAKIQTDIGVLAAEYNQGRPTREAFDHYQELRGEAAKLLDELVAAYKATR